MTDYTIHFKNIFRCAALGLFMVCLFAACRKTEFMPPPVGEPIAYADSSLSFSAFMKKSPSYSLFWQAWQRSGIEKVLTQYDPNYAFSVFVPDNAAMEAAGLSSDKIKSASIIVLDSLLRLHVVLKKLYPEPLGLQLGNLELVTLLSNKEYGEYDNDAEYKYRYYLAVKGGNISLNGRISGASSNIRVVKEACIIPINRVLKKPQKSTRQVLFEDGRFKMYLGIRRYNDSLYNAIISEEQTYTYPTPYENRYVVGTYSYPKAIPVLDFLSASNYTYNTFSNEFDTYKLIHLTTIFVPTDEAFQRAGFKTLEDLIRLNERAIPYPDYPGSEVLSGYLPTDSILNNHFLQNNSIYVRSKRDGGNIVASRAPKSRIILYSNDLTNELMKTYTVHELINGTMNFSLANNLDFVRNGENISIKVKGSEAEAAVVIQKDIETFNGVIHVVDRLLLPSGFKLH